MSVTITVRLQEAEADAWIRAYDEGRKGWHSIPPLALQRADFKIMSAIFAERANHGENA